MVMVMVMVKVFITVLVVMTVEVLVVLIGGHVMMVVVMVIRDGPKFGLRRISAEAFGRIIRYYSIRQRHTIRPNFSATNNVIAL